MCSVHDKVNIEVAFALPDRQELIEMTVDHGTTVDMAISKSGIGARFPEVDLGKLQAGIWGRIVSRDHLLVDGDRLELYRPLLMDPRDARRELALIGGSMGRSVDDAKDPD